MEKLTTVGYKFLHEGASSQLFRKVPQFYLRVEGEIDNFEISGEGSRP